MGRNIPLFMYKVYALKSIANEWIYVGMTTDIDRRVRDHNSGYNRSTKSKAPFLILFIEEYSDSISAREREKYLKTTSGKRYIRKQFVK